MSRKGKSKRGSIDIIDEPAAFTESGRCDDEVTLLFEGDKKLYASRDIIDEPAAFTESGRCDDEVTLLFEGDKKLYASKNFLRYASPVFEAMFTHDWKEEKKNCVELTGKKYDDFIEFLHCIHPRILKRITDKNVLQIVAIADEYQVTSIITKCKEFMVAWLTDSLQQAKSKGGHYLNQAVYLRSCLLILAKGNALNYDDVVDSAVKIVAKFGHIFYNKGQKVEQSYYYSIPDEEKKGDETLGEIKEKCMDIFNQLSFEIKFKILSERMLCLNYETSIM